LNDSLFARLVTASKARNLPPAELARETLEHTLAMVPLPAEHNQPSAYDLMKDGFGCVDSGLTDLASNPKHLEGLGRWRS
ncbi:MAG: hypothetical protein JWR15_336, partial [Prosthecobacter sp.]|nr:hypothetical protein [Prosthecobacter sp.]